MEPHAFQPYANPERNRDCSRCGRPQSASIHAVGTPSLTIPEARQELANLMASYPSHTPAYAALKMAQGFMLSRGNEVSRAGS